MKRLGQGTAAIVVLGLVASVGWMAGNRGSLGAPVDASPADDPLTPKIIEPSRATIRSVLAIDGAIRPVDVVSVIAERAGIVDKVIGRVGERLQEGETLITLSTPRGTLDIKAPAPSVVAKLDVVRGQRLDIGEVLAVLAPEGYRAEAVVDPSLLYRLYAPPIEIRAQIDRGPAPFDCPFLSLGADVDSIANPLDAPVMITCAVPREVRAFAGVRVRLAITTGIAENALVIPVEAVEGTADSGVVWVAGSDGGFEERSMTLGLSDGVRIQVLDGLTDGEKILEFPPPDAATGSAPQPTP